MNKSRKYSLTNALLLEMDRMELYQNLKTDELEIKNRPVKTWEDLRALLVLHREHDLIEKQAEAAGETAGQVMKNVIAMIPYLSNIAAIGGAFKDAGELALTLRDLAKEDRPVQKDTLFGILQIDPEYADIIDYGIQDDIIRDFMKEIEENTGNITDDGWTNMNEYVEWWLENNYGDGPETVTGANDSTKFTDLKIPDLPLPFIKGLVATATELF